jgi:hypothetical protein
VEPVPLSMPALRSRQAEQFHRALEAGAAIRPSDPSSDPTSPLAPAGIGGYVEVATRLAELVPTTSLRPDPAYRAELHSRLLDLANARAAELPARAPSTAGRADGADRADRDGRWRVGALTGLTHRWQRALAAGTAAVLALMLGVGVAAGSALPGGLLYPVKELIQNAQVRLAHGDLARGKVLLSQATGHIGDATTLVSQGSPAPADVNTALRQASDDFSQGEELLLNQYAASHDPDGLAALSRFTVSQSPLVGRLRDRVPVVSQPLVDQLLAQIGQSAVTLQRVVSQCGAPCAGVSLVNLPGPNGLPAATPGGEALTGDPTGAGGVAGLGSANGDGGLGGLLGTGGGAGVGLPGGTGGLASLGSGGAGVNLPGVGATVPAPQVGVSSGGVQVGVPGGSATLGPVTATLPGVTLGLGQNSSTHPPVNSTSSQPSVCLLIICLGG